MNANQDYHTVNNIITNKMRNLFPTDTITITVKPHTTRYYGVIQTTPFGIINVAINNRCKFSCYIQTNNFFPYMRLETNLGIIHFDIDSIDSAIDVALCQLRQ